MIDFVKEMVRGEAPALNPLAEPFGAEFEYACRQHDTPVPPISPRGYRTAQPVEIIHHSKYAGLRFEGRRSGLKPRSAAVGRGP